MNILSTVIMTENRILIIGDGNHQFITNYAIWLKKRKGVNITLDILSTSPLKKSSYEFFDTCFQIDFNSNYYNFISKIKVVRRFYRYFQYNRLVSSIKEYQFVHFHFIDIDSNFLANCIGKKFNSKIILSIWGSDLYKLNRNNEIFFLNTVNLAHTITFTNEKSSEYFKEKFNWDKDNLRICRFGLAPLEHLKNLTLSKSECKRKLGIEESKIVITLGYNLSPAQQHLKIIEQFEKDDLKLLKGKIVLLFPITYGGTIQYKEELLNKINELSFEYYVFDSFLSDEQIALLRKASDIMIQLQETDQFSGSMQEHLYTRNVVVTGSWLPYDTMKEQGVWFIEIDTLNELSKVILDVLENFEDYKDLTVENPKFIEKLSSWGDNIQFWFDLYKN